MVKARVRERAMAFTRGGSLKIQSDREGWERVLIFMSSPCGYVCIVCVHACAHMLAELL